MKDSPKLKIKEAENVIDSPVNKEKILERLSAMNEDIIYVRKEIENGGNHEDHKENVGKELKEDMVRNEHTMKKMEEEEMKRKEGLVLKEKWKVENDPRAKLKKKVHEIKVNNLVNNFAKKISMNNIERDPVDYNPFEEKRDTTTSESLNGLEIPNALKYIFYTISIINIIVMLVIASMSIIFEETMNCQGVILMEVEHHGYLFK